MSELLIPRVPVVLDERHTTAGFVHLLAQYGGDFVIGTYVVRFVPMSEKDMVVQLLCTGKDLKIRDQVWKKQSEPIMQMSPVMKAIEEEVI